MMQYRKSKKKYVVIARIKEHGFWRVAKWNCNNLLSFTAFLDRNFQEWAWFNVYDKYTREQVGNFTKFNRPMHKFI